MTQIQTLSLHDALPILPPARDGRPDRTRPLAHPTPALRAGRQTRGESPPFAARRSRGSRGAASRARSEEHTSELQSHHDLVCRLLLEKKKSNPIVLNVS